MDKKAVNILFKTYWKNGWIDGKNRIINKDDFIYAKSKGIMFDSISITHDECIKNIFEIINKISLEKVSKAFISSFSNGRIDWRSAIASYHVAKQLPLHKYKETDNLSYPCKICGQTNCKIAGFKNYKNVDLNVLNFERIKWGGVRHGDLVYTLFDLNQFLLEEISEPTEYDIEILQNILKTITESGLNEYPGSLRERLTNVLESTKYERHTLLEILACIEILKPASYDRPTTEKNDWKFVEYWRGEDKYNINAVKYYFGKYI